jgi:hypothetical protein
MFARGNKKASLKKGDKTKLKLKRSTFDVEVKKVKFTRKSVFFDLTLTDFPEKGLSVNWNRVPAALLD